MIEKLFNKYGFTFEEVDTNIGQFNLDKDWLETKKPVFSESEYSYTVPVVFTVEEKQKLIDYYDEGKLLITIGYAIDYDKEKDTYTEYREKG